MKIARIIHKHEKIVGTGDSEEECSNFVMIELENFWIFEKSNKNKRFTMDNADWKRVLEHGKRNQGCYKKIWQDIRGILAALILKVDF